MASPRPIALSSLCFALLVGLAHAPPTQANPILLATNAAQACKQVFPNGANDFTPNNKLGFGRITVTNLEDDPADDIRINVSCGFPLIRPEFFDDVVGSGGFDLRVVVSSERAATQTVTCTAESFDGGVRNFTTRSVPVSTTQANIIHFGPADLPANTPFSQVVMTCNLPERTAIGRMFLVQPQYSPPP
jgi:hypothetical protein